jgi:transcriptional regulator with XRE-family HTH domain
MRSLSDLARQRLVTWMAARPTLTQTEIAKAVGVTQSWVSQYKRGDIDPDVDQLDALARVFGHTLNELFDLRPDPQELELIEAFRALPPAKRALAVASLQAMSPELKTTRRSSRTR